MSAWSHHSSFAATAEDMAENCEGIEVAAWEGDGEDDHAGQEAGPWARQNGDRGRGKMAFSSLAAEGHGFPLAARSVGSSARWCAGATWCKKLRAVNRVSYAPVKWHRPYHY